MSVDRWRALSSAMRTELFSARTLDLGGSLDAARLAEMKAVLARDGALHVRQTGLASVEAVLAAMPALGFGPLERFTLGGRTSAETQEKWVAPGLRRMDFYPPDLYLLPNNEVQYRRVSPRWVLFAALAAPEDGGRIFLHRAQAVEAELRRTSPELIERILRHGLSIETGFLDRAHPEKAANYFQSWQERFATDDPDEALARARAQADEYDAAWFEGDRTLMTRITLTAAWEDEHGAKHLRFPRIALDPPAARNGFRRFPLGNGEELSADDHANLRAAYLATREGVPLATGDLVLFDNLRFGHSRESFSRVREVYVGMAGEIRDPALPQPRPSRAIPEVRRIARPGPTHYAFPPDTVDFGHRFPARTFDAQGTLDARTIAAIQREFERHGAVHVQRTGLRCEHGGALPETVLNALRFGRADAFPWGGMSSGRTTRRALSPELRATDDYPAHLWLLPHNEVLYQRSVPARLLFFSATDVDPAGGGRTFVHSAELFESRLRARGRIGESLLESLRIHGLRIETGFLDAHHPAKAENYFRSWQDRFATDDRDEALARCRAATHQFDECWWREEGNGLATLMTRIHVPAFHGKFLLFPRIALDGPGLVNGYRLYPRGDGTPFTTKELDLLLTAFLETREGVHWRAGDLLLVDNIRYGHSREAYSGPRTLAVAMAGEVRIGAAT